jgi:hypothetical protein
MGTNGCAVCGVKAAARVNNVLYLSLEEALAAAKSGDTVTAMADYTITEVPDNELNSFMIPVCISVHCPNLKSRDWAVAMCPDIRSMAIMYI